MKFIRYFFFLCAFYASSLSAQEYIPLPDNLKHETNITEPLSIRKGYFGISTANTFSVNSRFFDSSGKKSYILKYLYTNFSGTQSYAYSNSMDLSYGITDRLNLKISIPYSYSNLRIPYLYEVVGVKVNQFSTTTVSKGFGNISTTLSYQICNKKTFFSVIGIILSIPSASYKITEIRSTGEKSTIENSPKETSLALLIKAKKISYPFAFEITNMYEYSLKSQEYKASSSNYTTLSFGILLNDWFSINNGWSSLFSSEVPAIDEHYIIPKSYIIRSGVMLNQQIKAFRLQESLLFPLAGNNGKNANNYLGITLSYKF